MPAGAGGPMLFCGPGGPMGPGQFPSNFDFELKKKRFWYNMNTKLMRVINETRWIGFSFKFKHEKELYQNSRSYQIFYKKGEKIDIIFFEIDISLCEIDSCLK